MEIQKRKRRIRNWTAAIIWVLAFALINYPIGAWGASRIHPFVFGMPFSAFYFWFAYLLLPVVNTLIAWKVWRD